MAFLMVFGVIIPISAAVGDYNVTYNANGGNRAPSGTLATNGVATVSSDIPTRENYTFAGWTTAIGSDVYYRGGNSLTVTADTELFAAWVPNADVYSGSFVDIDPAAIDSTLYNVNAVTVYRYRNLVNPAVWSDWSEWSTTPVVATSAKQVESEDMLTNVPYTEYRYHRFVWVDEDGNYSYSGTENSLYVNYDDYTEWSPIELPYNGKDGWTGTSENYETIHSATFYNRETRQVDNYIVLPNYRYRDLMTAAVYENWSAWSETSVTETETKQVETRTNYKVTLKKVDVTGVTLSKSAMTLNVGSSEALSPTIAPANATVQTVKWTSSNTNVATVNNSTVTAVSAGTAIITVTTDDMSKTAQCTVTVVVPVTGISLDNTVLTIPVNTSKTVTPTVTPSNATNKSVAWTTSNSTVATVNQTGIITAVSAGTAEITATTVDGSKVARCAITVVVPVVGFTLNKTELSLTAGENFTLIATVDPTNATNKAVIWSSDNPTVATVDANGGVTANIPGTAKITVTTSDGAKVAECAVTVPTPVTSIRLDSAVLTVNAGSTKEIIATVEPANATNKNIIWTSSNPSVATVSGGVVTGISSGTAEITAITVDGAKVASCVVTVVVPVASITFNKSELTLTVGGSETITATVLPENATNPTLTWISSEPTIATVNNGTITGIAIGTTTVKATNSDGTVIAVCTVVEPVKRGYKAAWGLGL